MNKDALEKAAKALSKTVFQFVEWKNINESWKNRFRSDAHLAIDTYLRAMSNDGLSLKKFEEEKDTSLTGFFPFTVELPFSLYKKFQESYKINLLSWFEVDLKVDSIDSATALVYHMKDSYYGGRGEFSGSVTLIDINKELKPILKQRAQEFAQKQIQKNREEAEKKEQEELADKILKSINR